jgi:RNA polymerase sigma-70 factor, ECF subfamily
MLEDEYVIVSRASKGESQAFGLLYDHYQPQIYRFVVLKVGRREEAEDITHQVFLAAWKSIPGYEHMGNPFSSWLYQIARNQIIDHYRSKKTDVDLEEPAAQAIASHDDLESDAHMRMEFQKIQVALKELSSDYQDVIIMRFIEEQSIKEVAAALGKSEGAVKLMQHRAIKELKKILGDTSETIEFI